MNNCIFCLIIAEKAPAEIIRQQPSSIAIKPLNPVTPGHILVIPRQHVSDFAENPLVTSRVMREAAYLAADIGGSFNLITSKGKEATQTIFHLHVHLVPRVENDGLILPWTGQK